MPRAPGAVAMTERVSPQKASSFAQRLPDSGGADSSMQQTREKVREALIAALFVQLNTSCTGALSCSELRPVASFLGFSGGETQWTLEFGNVCRYLGCNPNSGLGAPVFAKFLNDRSAQGLFCTEAELQTMVRRFAAKAAPIEANCFVDYSQSFDASQMEHDALIDCDFWNSLTMGKACAKPKEPQLDGELTGCQAFCGRGKSRDLVQQVKASAEAPAPTQLRI